MMSMWLAPPGSAGVAIENTEAQWNCGISAAFGQFTKNSTSLVRRKNCTWSSRRCHGPSKSLKKNCAQLFIRTSRSTRLTRAGKLFAEHVPRIFTALQQARDSVKAAANGFHRQLRIALSDGITPSRLPTLLALCRQDEPEVELRLFEVPLSQQLKGLHDDLYDVGFARSDEVGEGILALPVWNDPMMVAVPARHTLLAYKRIPLEELLRYPLVLCDPQACEGHARQVEKVLRRVDMEPLVAERVASCDLMMALVSAGFALGLTGCAHCGQP